MADTTTLTLGAVAFADFEIPDSLPFGGEQMLTVHKLMGGVRQVDAMGRDDEPLSWSGIFLGENALDRARSLDALRIGGQPQALAWSELSYSVLIKRFVADFRKPNYIPYQITCEVITDTASPPSSDEELTTDDMVDGDMDSISGLLPNVGDDNLTGLFGTFQSAVSGLSSLASATRAELGSLGGPLTAVQDRVSTLLDNFGAGIEGLDGFGGVAVGVPGEESAAALVSAATNMAALDPLNDVQSYLGRIAVNLSAVGASGSEVAVAGGDLYAIAAQQYGSPSEWPTIAQANNLTDPILDGPQTIRVPPIPTETDGVLSI